MVDMDGFESARKIRKFNSIHRNPLKIIFTSANDEDVAMKPFKNSYNCDGFLKKPIKKDSLDYYLTKYYYK